MLPCCTKNCDHTGYGFTNESRRPLQRDPRCLLQKNFKNISDFKYDALEPSLQFTSLFLTTPEVAGFPHAILVAPYRHVPHPDNESLKEWAFQEKGSKLSTRDMATYNLALTTLADMVVFVASSKAHSKTEDLTLYSGECGRERHICAQKSHLWHGSTTLFSREDIEAHTSDLYRSDRDIKWRTFETARILMHELMHAMAHARLSWLNQIPFGSNKAVETGYEWENYVFGGVIRDNKLRFSRLYEDATPLIREWPAASITRMYRHKGWRIDALEEPSAIEVWWSLEPVMHDWFDRLFTAEFWKKTVPEQGVSALRVSRIRGYRVKVAEDGTCTLFEWDSHDTASYGCTIPPDTRRNTIRKW
jgi:hypothetical protein